MIDFPANPPVGQIFISGGQEWQWDGVKWLPMGSAAILAPAMNDNRIINGDMRIDQRNNGASGTVANVYTADRWAYLGSQASKGSWQRIGTATAPGFPYALFFQSSSAYASLATDNFEIAQPIEADMVSDFVWGTTNAQPVTLSFWAWCTLAGTLSGSIFNYAQTRSYPFSYSLSANTWTKVVINIPPDTGGTWVMSGNAGAMYLVFDLGSGSNKRGPANAWASAAYVGVTGAVSVVGTNAAAFQVTGVKLEIGSVATAFNRKSLANSLADCQRYYQVLGGGQVVCTGYAGTGSSFYTCLPMPVQMRVAPSGAVSGTSYSNASNLAVSTTTVNMIITSATITATGLAWAGGTLALSAEL